MREIDNKEKLKLKIEKMREELNYMVMNDLDKNEVVNLSQELDIMINEFLSKEYKK